MQRNVMVGKCHWFLMKYKSAYHRWIVQKTLLKEIALTDILNRFLSSLSLEQRKIFMRRYWYLSPIKEIATEYGMSESKIKMSLFRSRNELKKLLEKEGISV
jgi:RNA polymerase sigma factor (sigma-70 family)